MLLILLKLLLKQELLLLLQLDLLFFTGLKLPLLLVDFLAPYLRVHHLDVAILETGADASLEAVVVPALEEGAGLVEWGLVEVVVLELG